MTTFQIRSNARNKAVDAELLTVAQMEKCDSLSAVIRMCRKEHPQASCGTIARFVTKYYHKTVSTNHVYNVLHTQLKRKG